MIRGLKFAIAYYMLLSSINGQEPPRANSPDCYSTADSRRELKKAIESTTMNLKALNLKNYKYTLERAQNNAFLCPLYVEVRAGQVPVVKEEEKNYNEQSCIKAGPPADFSGELNALLNFIQKPFSRADAVCWTPVYNSDKTVDIHVEVYPDSRNPRTDQYLTVSKISPIDNTTIIANAIDEEDEEDEDEIDDEPSGPYPSFVYTTQNPSIPISDNCFNSNDKEKEALIFNNTLQKWRELNLNSYTYTLYESRGPIVGCNIDVTIKDNKTTVSKEQRAPHCTSLGTQLALPFEQIVQSLKSQNIVADYICVENKIHRDGSIDYSLLINAPNSDRRIEVINLRKIH